MVTVNRISREVIEHKLLTALDDEDCVAIVVKEDDLDLIIHALGMVVASKHRTSQPTLYDNQLRHDLCRLRKEAFGK